MHETGSVKRQPEEMMISSVPTRIYKKSKTQKADGRGRNKAKLEEIMQRRMGRGPRMELGIYEHNKGTQPACIVIYNLLRQTIFNLVNYDEARRLVENTYKKKESNEVMSVEEEIKYWTLVYKRVERMEFRRQQKQEILIILEMYEGTKRSQSGRNIELEIAKHWAIGFLANRRAEGGSWGRYHLILEGDPTLVEPEGGSVTAAEDVVNGGALLFRTLCHFLGPKVVLDEYEGGKQWLQAQAWSEAVLKEVSPELGQKVPGWYAQMVCELAQVVKRDNMMEDGANENEFTQYLRADEEGVLWYNKGQTLFTPFALSAMVNARANMVKMRGGQIRRNAELTEAYAKLNQAIQEIAQIENRLMEQESKVSVETTAMPPMLWTNDEQMMGMQIQESEDIGEMLK